MQVRRALVVLLGSLSLAFPGAAAHAALYSHNDATRDVIWEACPGEDDAECPSEDVFDPSVREGDIVRANIRHQARRVLVRLKERQVSAAGYRSHYVRVVTDAGIERWVSVHATPGQLQPSSIELYDARKDVVRCSGLWAGADPATDLVTVIVPRRCLGHPRWVRVGVGVETMEEELSGELRDDLMKAGAISATLALSPRIRRG